MDMNLLMATVSITGTSEVQMKQKQLEIEIKDLKMDKLAKVSWEFSQLTNSTDSEQASIQSINHNIIFDPPSSFPPKSLFTIWIKP